MNAGSLVTCSIHPEKGNGKIISISSLFDAQYAEVHFSNGETLTVPLESLNPASDALLGVNQGQFGHPAPFFARNALLRLESNLSENKVTGAANYKITPLPHQVLTVHYVLNRYQPRCLIADEVGLGKTIEAILVYQEFKLRKMVNRVLIVVPSGLVLQWHEELLSKFNESFVIYNKEYIRTLKQSYGNETNVWNQHDKIIVSIDSVKPWRIDESLSREEKERRLWHNTHVTEALGQSGFDLVIIDEAHKLSKRGDGHESARFKLGSILSESVPVFLLLTATPHQGDPDLFHYLLKLVDPVLFANKDRLKPEFVKDVCVRNKKRAAVDFEGNRIFKQRITSIVPVKRNETDNAIELDLYNSVTEYITTFYNLAKKNNDQILILLLMLYQRILSSSSFALKNTLIRRQHILKKELDKSEEIEEYYDDSCEYSIEDILEKSTPESDELLQTEITFIEECLKKAESLTKIFGDAKLRELINVIKEISDREENPSTKFIIFTEFRSTQSAIVEFLIGYGYTCSIIHGGLSREERFEQVDLFRGDVQILVSTDAGGEGINLQFCYCLINYDLPWNPARLEQRIGRVDRIGQKNNVLIFNFHLEATVEDQVRDILEGKLKTVEKQFGEDRYADVMTLIQDEFSFDKIYLEAITKKETESKKLDKIAKEIYDRAKKLLEEEELGLPFSEFSSNASDLINTDINNIVSSLVLNFLKHKEIKVNWYKESVNTCFFNNPFAAKGSKDITIRNATFYNKDAVDSEKIELINADHSIVKNIRSFLNTNQSIGCNTAVKIKAGKFLNVIGYWFVYKFKITNNVDREKVSLISLFLENDGFINNRISTYLFNMIDLSYEPIHTELITNLNDDVISKAREEAEIKAKDIYLATKLDWMKKIDAYIEKSTDYFKLKENAVKNIRVDNIRKSKEIQLQQELAEHNRTTSLKKHIIPHLELYQAAYVEFA